MGQMNRSLRVVAFSVALLLTPASAYAVSVSSDDGSGTQSRTKSYANGATVSGQLKSTHGSPVYYSGKVNIARCSDSEGKRYTTSTTSKVGVTRGGTISAFIGVYPCKFAGVNSRVCKYKKYVPDPCGAWSNRY